MKTLICVLAGLAGLAIATLGWAIAPEPAFDDPVMQARYEQLTEELRCLVCQNQTIADSNAPLAQDLRREVREMLEEGASDDDVLDFMTARYGDFVRYSPPFAPKTWALWLAPGLLLALGVLVAVRIILRRSRLYTEDPAGESGP